MHLLQERPRRAISELVDATGLHANTVREHVQRLIDAGYVIAETEHRTTRGRPRATESHSSARVTAASSSSDENGFCSTTAGSTWMRAASTVDDG